MNIAKKELGHIFGDPFALATISIAYVRRYMRETLVDMRKYRLTDILITVGLVDSLCRLNYLRRAVRFPQLWVVGYCIFAMLHCWGLTGNGLGLGANLSCSSMWICPESYLFVLNSIDCWFPCRWFGVCLFDDQRSSIF